MIMDHMMLSVFKFLDPQSSESSSYVSYNLKLEITTNYFGVNNINKNKCS